MLVSAVTPWELGIQRALGRLDFPDGLIGALDSNGFVELPISAEHGAAAAELPGHHRDPFDRMLIAQARAESLVLVTANRSLRWHGIELLHATT